VFAPALVALFVPDEPDVIVVGARFVRIMCLAWGGIGVQLCIVAAFRASGNMFAGMLVALLSQFVIQLPLAVILSRGARFQADGLWWSFPIATFAAATMAVGWFALGGWKAALAKAMKNLVVRPGLVAKPGLATKTDLAGATDLATETDLVIKVTGEIMIEDGVR
jgi:Na+-driven multidrug efflux pump